MARWSKSTYEMVAEIISNPRVKRVGGKAIRTTLSVEFALKFQEDNEKFDYERFIKACKG